jgi:hypothetical protein
MTISKLHGFTQQAVGIAEYTLKVIKAIDDVTAMEAAKEGTEDVKEATKEDVIVIEKPNVCEECG